MKQLTAAYLRVSPSESKLNETIVSQRNYLLRYCESQQIHLIRRYEDDQVSGSVPMELRPAGGRLLHDAAEGTFESLLVYRIDRLGRDTVDSLGIARKLRECGVGIISVTEPFDTSGPTGEFLFTLLAGVAQMERATILRRTYDGKHAAAADGRWNGGRAPYGYVVVERRLQVEVGAAAVVRRAFALYVELTSLSAVARVLNAESVASPGGSVWTQAALSKIVHNPVYAGHGSFRRWHLVREREGRCRIERGPDHARIAYVVPAIVGVDLFEEAQAVLRSHPLANKRSAEYDYLLAGLIRCHCGARMHGSTGKANGKLYPYYRCRGCRIPQVPAAQVEAGVWAKIEELAANPGPAIKRLRQQTKQYLEIEDERAGIDAALTAKDQERERVISMCRRGRITEEDLDVQIAQIAAERKTLSDRLTDLNRRQSNVIDIRRRLTEKEEMLQTLKHNVGNRSGEQKRRMMNTLVYQVVVSHDGQQHRMRVEIDFDLDAGAASQSSAWRMPYEDVALGRAA